MLSASIPPASARTMAARSTRSLLKGVRRAALASVCLAIWIRGVSLAYAVRLQRTYAPPHHLHGDDDLPSRVALSEVPECVGCLAQLVAPVDDGPDPSGLEELAH